MDILLIILGMAVVTHIPRILPPAFMRSIQLPSWFASWLQCIPYAALAALIFPGILSVQPDEPAIGLAGGATAIILAIFKAHILIIMILSILVTWLGSCWLV
jgi:branched-subunit amino acid transport protein